MPNGTAHRVGAAFVIGSISAHSEYKNGQNTSKPLAHAGLAAFCGTLPDFLEPAFHPNHRQFFHSLTFACTLGYGLYKLHKWEPQDSGDKLEDNRLDCRGGLSGSPGHGFHNTGIVAIDLRTD